MELKDDEGEKKTPECPYCNDKPSRRKCYYCHCRICDSKEDAENTLLCDECDNAYHMQCLDPPIASIPSDDQWWATNSIITGLEIMSINWAMSEHDLTCSDKHKFSQYVCSRNVSTCKKEFILFWALSSLMLHISGSSTCHYTVHIRFCPDCKNDTSDVITAGKKLKLSKKKSKMMSNINKECTRDWGKVHMHTI